MSVLKEEKLNQLDKILQSHALHGAESLKAFLRFVGLSAINQPETQLKEYVIATEVFGRRSDYDPRIDSAVRVQAGRLRTKLQEYYATEGKYDKVQIDLPKGKYTPVFSYAKLMRAEDTNGTHRLMETAEAEATASVRQVALPLWEELLRAPEPVLVVFSNSVFHGNYDEMRLFSSLDVLEGHHDVPTSASSLNLGPGQPPVIDHYTGIGEVMGVYFLGDFFAKMHHPFRIKRSLLLTWDDAKMENIVVFDDVEEAQIHRRRARLGLLQLRVDVDEGLAAAAFRREGPVGELVSYVADYQSAVAAGEARDRNGSARARRIAPMRACGMARAWSGGLRRERRA